MVEDKGGESPPSETQQQPASPKNEPETSSGGESPFALGGAGEAMQSKPTNARRVELQDFGKAPPNPAPSSPSQPPVQPSAQNTGATASASPNPQASPAPGGQPPASQNPPASASAPNQTQQPPAQGGVASQAKPATPQTPAPSGVSQASSTPPPTPQAPASQGTAHKEPQTSAGGSEKKSGRPMRIGEKLISLGLISGDQLQIALQEQKQSRKLLGAILVDMGFLTESALTEVLAESAGTQRFDPKAAVLDTNVIRKIPKDVAARQKILAVEHDGNMLKLAMADIYNVLALDQVRRYFPKDTKMVPVYCTESEILEMIDQYYDYETSIDGILKEIETGIRDQSVVLEGETDGYVNPTVRLVNAILVDSIKKGASDIHFEPEGNFLRLRYRIDGNLIQVRSFHMSYWSAIAVRIKIMSGMNIAETRNPQDGRISYNVLGREVDFRVASHPMVHGENIVMRLLDKAKSLVGLDQLGFSEHNIRLLKKLLKRPEGIVIVTGPTGSGKTTTLYSVLDYINSMDVNIMTLEDPVEYQLPLIRQTNVKEGSTDFVNGIKSLMRQDPDIIFVGEVRDEETALMAVRAALTGHQVFTTLHTNDAIGAIARLMDIGIPAHLLSGTLICTMAQRLARKLCSKCKQSRPATVEECQILGYPSDEAPIIYDPVGCESCDNKGYKGRVGINEIFALNPELDELIARGATRNRLMEAALENGYVRMIDDGIDKVINGMIDLRELMNRIDMTERM